MAIRIGGGRGGRGVSNAPRPQNYQVGARARERIDSLLPRMAEHRTQSIAVDGSPILVWRRGRGSRPCTCTSSQAPNNFQAIALDRGTTRTEDMASNSLGNDKIPTQMNSGLNAPSDYAADFSEGWNPYDVTVEPEFDPDFSEAKIEEPTARDSGWLDRVIEEGPFQTGQAIKCPVCFGSSYTDTWKPFKGVRILGDLAEQTKWQESGGDLHTEARPSLMRLQPGASITWQLFIPKFFSQVLRSVVWNGQNKLSEIPQVNVQPIVEPGSPQTPMWRDATPATLAALQGNGAELNFRLTAVSGEIEFTHFEIVIMLDDFSLAHVPEIDVPYDSEFVDYNTIVTMELPIDAEVSEGDIVAENKHGRLWLATSVSKKQTGSGKSYGSDATFRTIHANEVYYPMNVFKEK